MANYREPQWLLPNEKNLQYPAAGATQGSGLTADRHSLYSMDFDGTDHINHGSPSELLTTGAFSVSWWMKTTVTADDALILMDDWSAGNRNWQIVHLSSGNVIRFYVFGSPSAFVPANTSINDGNWHHVVCTYEPSTALRIYIDGSLDNSNTTSIPATRNNSAANLRIGKDDFNNYYTGSMDEVAIFSRALSSNEVNDLWNGGAPSNPMLLSGKPLAYYPLGEQARNPNSSNWRFPNEVLQGQAISFDGSGDYIDCGHSALTAISGGSTTLSTPMTISMWFKLGSSSTSKGLINFGDLNNNYGGFSIRHESNTLSFIRATQHIITGGYTFTDTTSWHNMILIYDPSNSSNCYVYIDGSDTGVTFNSNVGNIDFLNSNGTQRNLIIGAYYGLSETFTGKMSNVAIWNSDQSANIANIYNYGAPQTSYTVTPTAWYKLDKTSTFTGLNPNWHSALDFNSSQNDYIALGTGIGNELGSSYNGVISISTWFYFNGTWDNSINDGIIQIGGNLSNNYGKIAIYGAAQSLYVDTSNNSGSKVSAKIANVNNAPYSFSNRWVHLTVVWDLQNSNNSKIYIDGSAVDLTQAGNLNNWTTDTIDFTNKESWIAAYFNSTLTWNGLISNTAIFKQAISAEDVKYLYNGGTPQTNISFEPLSWYKLDNTTTGIQDSGSASNNGTNNGATEVASNVAVDEWVFENTVQSQTPNWSSALSFDGSSHVEVSDSDSLSFGNGSTDSAFSVSTWVNFDDVTNSSLFSKSNVAPTFYEYSAHISSEQIAFGLYSQGDVSGSNNIFVVTTATLTSYEGSWINLTFTYDGSRNVSGLKIYLNGDEMSTSTVENGTYVAMTNTAAPFKIGRSFNNRHLKGKQSNTQIWNTELSSIQVETLYNNGTPLTTAFESPVSWWKLDNTTTGIQDSVGSNNGTNNGTTEIQTNVWTPRLNGDSDTLPSTALVSSDLQFNSAYSSFSLDFDGTDDYIQTGGLTINNTFTFSCWLNVNSFSLANQCFLSSPNYFTSGFDGNFIIRLNNNTTINFYSYDGTGSSESITCTVPTINTSSWHHFALTNDGSTAQYYWDGSPITTTGVNTKGLDNLSAGLIIGDNITNNNNAFNGKIDETAIWNRALNQAEITSIYNSGYPKDITALSPISWWRLGEDAYFNGTDFIIPNQITGAPNGTSDNMTATDLVADAPGSYAAGLATGGLALDDRLGEAPNSTANSLSFNMTPLNRVSYPAGYTPTQVDNVYSMTFDGSNDYISTSDVRLGNTYSISLWFNANSFPSTNPVLISQYVNAAAGRFFIGVRDDGGGRKITAFSAAHNYGSTVISTSTWYNVVLVNNNNTVTLYLNGSVDGNFTFSSAPPDTNILIGALDTTPSNPWDGKIDEVAIFDYALSARQIKQDIYNATTSGKTADLNNISNLTAPIAWYRMGD